VSRRWRDFWTSPGTVSVLTLLGLFIACMLMASCGASPEATAAGLRAVDAMAARGAISPNEADALRQALYAAAEPRWLEPLMGSVVSILGAVGIVMKMRGPTATPSERVMRQAARVTKQAVRKEDK
jgi:hypothetical protein